MCCIVMDGSCGCRGLPLITFLTPFLECGEYYDPQNYDASGWDYGADLGYESMQDPNCIDDFYGAPTENWDGMSDGATEMSGSMYSQDCGEACPMPADYECPMPSDDCCPPDCGPEGRIIGDLNFDDLPNSEEPSKGSKLLCGDNLRKVNMIIQAITPETVLDEFMMSIAEYTSDKGEVMFDVMSNEVQNFKELIKEIYNNRNDHVSDLMRAQQRQQKNKYDKWTNDLNKRADLAMERLKQLMPNFNLSAYNEDPDNYIYRTITENTRREANQKRETVGPEGVNPFGGCGAVPGMTDKGYRVGLHKKTWLVREAEKIECENEQKMAKLNEMMGQLACLSEGIATSNKKLAAYNRQLEGQATCLRNKLAENERVINCLMDEVDVNKRTSAEGVDDGSVECGIIRPEDVLKPFPRGYGYC